MKRTYRQLSSTTKQKISQAMQKHYANMTQAAKDKTNQKKSEAQKRYWATIPNRPDVGNGEVDNMQ